MHSANRRWLMTYKQALEDHKYLWSIGPADDMTGSYVDQEDLKRLLLSPTKTTARDCLCSQIDYWFQVGPDTGKAYGEDVNKYIRSDTKVREIAERHNCI